MAFFLKSKELCTRLEAKPW